MTGRGAGRRNAGQLRRYPRSARVNEVLRQVLAEEIERLADADERLGMLTVTGVDTDPDLRRARVLLDSIPQEAADALEAARPRLQGALARQVRIKWTPTLTFAADPAIAGGERVEEIIRGLHAADRDPGSDT